MWPHSYVPLKKDGVVCHDSVRLPVQIDSRCWLEGFSVVNPSMSSCSWDNILCGITTQDHWLRLHVCACTILHVPCRRLWSTGHGPAASAAGEFVHFGHHSGECAVSGEITTQN